MAHAAATARAAAVAARAAMAAMVLATVMAGSGNGRLCGVWGVGLGRAAGGEWGLRIDGSVGNEQH